MILARRKLELPTKEFQRVCASRWPSRLPHSGLRLAGLRLRGGVRPATWQRGACSAALIDEFEARSLGEEGGLGGLIEVVVVDAAREERVGGCHSTSLITDPS